MAGWMKEMHAGMNHKDFVCVQTVRALPLERLHMFKHNKGWQSPLFLCLLLTHQYTDVGCFSVSCSLCCAPFLMRKIISQLFVPQLQRLLHVPWEFKHTHTHTDTCLSALQLSCHIERGQERFPTLLIVWCKSISRHLTELEASSELSLDSQKQTGTGRQLKRTATIGKHCCVVKLAGIPMERAEWFVSFINVCLSLWSWFKALTFQQC